MFRLPRQIIWWGIIAFILIFLLAPVTGHVLLFQLIHNLEVGFTGHKGVHGPHIHVGG